MYRRSINNRVKAFYLIFKIFFVLNEAWTDLDFEFTAVKIRSKLSEIYHFKCGHLNFYKQILTILRQSIF